MPPAEQLQICNYSGLDATVTRAATRTPGDSLARCLAPGSESRPNLVLHLKVTLFQRHSLIVNAALFTLATEARDHVVVKALMIRKLRV